MEKTKELILLHSGMKHISNLPSAGVNIMLTPQFYTIKREDLPVKYAYQAKRVAPSLFEGLLEDTEQYKYFVAKEENNWLFIAYDENEIKSFLAQKGIDVAQISKVYFAEQSVAVLQSPILLGEKEALVNLDGTMTIVPQIALSSDEKPMQVNANITPKKGVSFEGRNESLFSLTQAYIFAAMLTLFALIYFWEGSRYDANSAEQEAQMQTLLEEYPSLQSSYTRTSIANKYKTIDKKERKKRDVIKALSHMIFNGSTLTSLAIDDKKFQAVFACKDTTITKKLQELAKKEKFNTSKIANSNDLKLEGSL